ncbi:MAG: hypothetical protein JST66_06320 [Bacteroidetes bacterium]|nr:hypothetical protein [Bacteroidota bacterium]
MKKHLTTLSILHYVYGALVCVGGLSLLVFVALGSFLGSDWLLEHAQGDVPPAWLGGFFRVLGWTLFAFLEVKGVLNIISGALIAQQRGRTFSLVVGGLNCLNIPFGIALAIFTFITLSDDEVRRAYGTAVA